MPGEAARATTPAQTIDDLNEPYGQLLKERREALELSQLQLADLAGVHRGTIRNAEMGKPLELRTHSNLLCALGCAPNVKNRDDRHHPHLDQVFSPRVAKIAIQAFLLLRDAADGPTTDEYVELVTELSKGRILSMQLGFCDELVTQMRPLDAELFDAEVATLAPDDYPVRWIDGKRLNTELPRPRTVAVKARVTGVATAQAVSVPVLTQESGAGGTSLKGLIAQGLAGESGLAQLALEGIDAGVPQQAIVLILQADISDENRQKLMRHAVKRAAEVQLALVHEIGLLAEMAVKQ